MEYAETAFGHVLALDPGDEIVRSLIAYARREDVDAGAVLGLGAVDRAVVGAFSLERDDYIRHTFEEQLELASLTGTLSLLDGEPFPHVHAVFARPDLSTVGGHVFEAVCSVTVELVVRADPDAALHRSPVEHCSLQLLDPRGDR